MTCQSPSVSAFKTPKQENAYLAWFQVRVAASLADERPPIPHDDVMAEIRRIVSDAASHPGDDA